MELVYARGYSSVGVKELCEVAGVNRGSFYHFFRSKRELLLQVIARFTEGHRRRRAETMGFPPLERIQRIFQLTFEHHRAVFQKTGKIQGCSIGNLAIELSTRDAVINERLRANFQEWVDYFGSALQEAMETGVISEVDPDTSAQAILAYLEGILLLANTQNDIELLRRLTNGAHLKACPIYPDGMCFSLIRSA